MSQDIINNYRAETEQYFRDICGMNAGEIEAFVKAEAERIFGDYDMDVRVVDAVIYGSRSRGLKRMAPTLMWYWSIKARSRRMLFSGS